MKFFNKLKSSIIGSIKEDLNSALGAKQALFNSKISGALDDIISMKTGIQISNIPSKITERTAQTAQARREALRNELSARYQDQMHDYCKKDSFLPPESRDIYKFPTDDQRFVDNWILIRTVPRHIDAQHVHGTESDSAYSLAEMKRIGFTTGPEGASAAAKKDLVQGSAANKQVSIALYFPNAVKDTVSVEYEQKDVGISDTILNAYFGKGGDIAMASGDALGDGFKEAWKGMANKMISVRAIQEGVAANAPKFTNFSGVTLRDHTYTFNLNPYNQHDAHEITKIIETFKLMALPASSAANPRLKILPAEWQINWMGPILGHIEHPQNCFLSTVDVDYSGGKDMSFIETVTPSTTKGEGEDAVKTAAAIQHYPNGVTLTLTFKEILQLTRQRYMRRVAPSVEGGNVPQDTVKDLINEDMGRADDERKSDERQPLDEEHYNNAKEGYVRQDGKFAGDAIYGRADQARHAFYTMYGRRPEDHEIVKRLKPESEQSFWSSDTYWTFNKDPDI